MNNIPTFKTMEEVYVDINGSMNRCHKPRWQDIRKKFIKLYGCEPDAYVRAPGRVSIVGEHADYCGYNVLPAALEADFIMAYMTVKDGPGSDEILVNNTDKNWPIIRVSNDPKQVLKSGGGSTNYFLCGYKAVLFHDKKVKDLVKKPVGLKIFISSNVPPAGGLSSSSAFTVCTAITTAHANGILNKLSKEWMSNAVWKAETAAGTMCGAMDQTISIMGKQGKSLQIHFNPTITT